MDRFVAVIDGVEHEYVCELDIGTPDGEPAVAAGTPVGEPAAAPGTPDGEPAAAAGTPAWGTLPPPGVSYSVWCNICARKFSNRMTNWFEGREHWDFDPLKPSIRKYAARDATPRSTCLFQAPPLEACSANTIGRSTSLGQKISLSTRA